MNNNAYPCDLCGQPVHVSGFELKLADGLKKFCCAGCLSIFQLLNPEPTSTQSSSENIS